MLIKYKKIKIPQIFIFILINIIFLTNANAKHKIKVTIDPSNHNDLKNEQWYLHAECDCMWPIPDPTIDSGPHTNGDRVNVDTLCDCNVKVTLPIIPHWIGPTQETFKVDWHLGSRETDKTIVFIREQYSLAVNVFPGGKASATLSKGAPYYYEDNVDITFTPEDGYEDDGVTINTKLGSNTKIIKLDKNKYRVQYIDRDVTVEANFKLTNHDVEFKAVPPGSGTPSSTVSVKHDTLYSFDVNSSTGYCIDSVDARAMALGGEPKSNVYRRYQLKTTVTQDIKGADAIVINFAPCSAIERDDDHDGYSEKDGDCDDTVQGINPGAAEIPCNAIDEDCDHDYGKCLDASEVKCVDIADVPLDIMLPAATSNIMFIFDNSGSMDWSMMMTDYNKNPGGLFYGISGSYHIPHVYSYIFDVDDHLYTNWTDSAIGGFLADVATFGAKFGATILNEIGAWLDVFEGWDAHEAYKVQDEEDEKWADFYEDWDIFGLGEAMGNVLGGDVLSEESRARWQSQCAEYNKMYYNPKINYTKWPMWDGMAPGTSAGDEINKENPRSDPMKAGHTLNMFDEYVSISKWAYKCTKVIWCFWGTGKITDNDVKIVNAHYYTRHTDGNIYLVNMDHKFDVYKITHPYRVDIYDLKNTVSPPAGLLTRSFDEELQNFANWFTFYRRREFAAKAAIGNIVTQMEGVKAGITTINLASPPVAQPLLNIKVGTEEGTLDDQSDVLLTKLYNIESLQRGTPLRRALHNVGEYYEEGGSNGGLGAASPFKDSEGGCQQAFTIMLTDGYWNGSGVSVGNTDGDGNTAYDTAEYRDEFSNTLADVAMKFYENDIASVANNVPTNSFDQASHQHMVFYGVSFGVPGTLEIKADCPPNCEPWPRPIPEKATTLDDLYHASLNSRGRFLSASDPMELVNKMGQVMQDIVQRQGSAASVSANTPEVSSKTLIYQGSYNTGDWSGDLKAYKLNIDDDGGAESLKDDYEWSANEELEKVNFNDRKIYTNVNGSVIEFNAGNIGSFSTKQKSFLGTNDIIRANVINYIRGDRSNEGTFYRKRSSIIGDIINSSPVPVEYDGNNFVFVGSNDGMLHAFDDTGKEIFAYIPNLIFHKLSYLTSIYYDHEAYVDGTPYVVSKDFIDNKLILIGGMGKGARGYYCLNITDVTSWEYPPQAEDLDGVKDDDYIGYCFGKAFVVNSKAGWVAVFGNGYNSPKNEAVLYVLALNNDGTLKDADDPKRIYTNVGGSEQCNGLSTPALIDVDYDGYVDYAYAGDLRGNLWKFDLTDSNIENWKIAFKDSWGNQPLFQASTNSLVVQPITSKPDIIKHCKYPGYIVVFGTGRYLGEQDFKDETQQSIYGIWDYSEAVNSWNIDGLNSETSYQGIFLPPVSGVRTTNNSKKYLGNVSLLKQSKLNVANEDRLISTNEIKWFSKEEECTSASPCHVGWYLDLPDTKERVTKDVMVAFQKAIVVSTVPSVEPCEAGATSFVYLIDACTGGSLDTPTIDVNEDDEINEDDIIKVGEIGYSPSRLKFEGNICPPLLLSSEQGDKDFLFFSNSTGKVTEMSMKSDLGIFYWKEIK